MKINVKEKLGEIKNFWGKLDKKIKILSAVITVLIVGGSIAAAFVLNQKTYVPVFAEVSEEEATEIVGYLQSEGVDYQYKGGGTILVEESQADLTRANLVYEGYPSSGFAYDTYINNAGGMTTDSEKETYELYELQNRIGATIGLFNGVKDAKVTIALGEEQTYVLQDESELNGASASVVVTMKSGEELEEAQAEAIRRLVSKSVSGMEMEDVAVFDENMVEYTEDQTEEASGSTEVELANIVEQKIEQKVANILSPFYGAGNIRVSANGKINMEKVIRETATYTTPDKIDENDKTGIVSSEQGTESNSSGTTTSGGVTGTETNSDTTEYNEEGEGTDTDSSESMTYDREYLVNYVKEQTEVDAGLMDDLTVSISVNGDDLGKLNENEVRELVANATGITMADAVQKIAVVAAPFYVAEDEAAVETVAEAQNILDEYWWVFAIAGGVLILLVILIFMFRRKIKKRKMQKSNLLEEEKPVVQVEEAPPEDYNIDLLNMQNQKGRELRENIRDFADTNPEISAQMLRTWLGGGDQDGGN